jgi:NAD(P)-dependent dehydrogenase (short-subunit alcohol dehydrogenase family)
MHFWKNGVPSLYPRSRDMPEQFNAESTTDQVMAGVDLTGKTAVVTGGSAGLGIETGRVLAGAGARVVMVGRDPEKLAAAVEGIRGAQPAAQIEQEVMDLADLDSVRAAAARLLERCPEIQLLINNAGVMACPLERTAQGFELQFGTNHIGHFLFTCLLAPSLLAAAPGRIVNLSSAGHRFGGIDFDDPNYERRDYDKWQAYGQSKTANALFSVALEKRLGDRGVHAYAVHPGMIITELGRHLEQSDIDALTARAEDMPTGFKSVPAGAATSVWAASSVDLEGRGGIYLEDCHVAEVGDPQSGHGVAPYAIDPGAAERLWSLSEQLVGQQFEL